MAEIVDYNVSAGSNNSASPNGMPENMPASGVNNAWREHAARHKRHWKDTDGSVTVGGTSTAMTVTLNKGTTTLADIGPMILEFIASGAAPTLAVNGGTAKNLCWPDGTNVGSGEIAVNTRALVLYDADKDKFVILSSAVKPTSALLTTRGDIIYASAANTPARLAIGAANTVLKSDGTDPSWGNVTVTGANIVIGSDAQGDVLYYNGSAWTRLGAGTSGQFLKTQGAAANPTWASTRTLGTADASISGTASVAYSSLPAGLNGIDIYFEGISPTNNVDLLLQAGDSGGLHTTGYNSHSENGAGSDATSTAGFLVQLSAAADVAKGTIGLRRVDGHKWMAWHMVTADNDDVFTGIGIVTLDTDLDRVSLICSDSANFDAGTFVNISYW